MENMSDPKMNGAESTSTQKRNSFIGSLAICFLMLTTMPSIGHAYVYWLVDHVTAGSVEAGSPNGLNCPGGCAAFSGTGGTGGADVSTTCCAWYVEPYAYTQVQNYNS